MVAYYSFSIIVVIDMLLTPAVHLYVSNGHLFVLVFL